MPAPRGRGLGPYALILVVHALGHDRHGRVVHARQREPVGDRSGDHDDRRCAAVRDLRAVVDRSAAERCEPPMAVRGCDRRVRVSARVLLVDEPRWGRGRQPRVARQRPRVRGPLRVAVGAAKAVEALAGVHAARTRRHPAAGDGIASRGIGPADGCRVARPRHRCSVWSPEPRTHCSPTHRAARSPPVARLAA